MAPTVAALHRRSFHEGRRHRQQRSSTPRPGCRSRGRRAPPREKTRRRLRPRATRSIPARGRAHGDEARAGAARDRATAAGALTELARLETENMGKPIVESEFDVADAATCFEYYGGLATKITGEVNPVPDEALSLTLKEPVGVCGQIIPWNYPLLMAAWKIAPALCAGLHRGAEARRGHPDDRSRARPHPGRHRRTCPRAWSTSSPATARWWGRSLAESDPRRQGRLHRLDAHRSRASCTPPPTRT